MQENLKECFTLIMCTVHSEKIEVNQCICVNVYIHPGILGYISIFTVYRYSYVMSVCRYKMFCSISIPVLVWHIGKMIVPLVIEA